MCIFRISILSILLLTACSDSEVVDSSTSVAEAETSTEEDVNAKPNLAELLADKTVEQENRRNTASKRLIPEGAHKLQKVAIVDSQGFGKPIAAVTALIPIGWKPNGGVVWKINNSGCGVNGTSFQWEAVSPDGLSRLAILPEETWSGNNLGMPAQGPCPNLWLTSVRDYLKHYVARNRPAARIKQYRDRKDIAKGYQHLNNRTPMPGGEMQTWVEAGEVLLEYEYDGRIFEETLARLIIFRLNKTQGVYPGEIRQFLTISTLPGFSMRAPQGKLDQHLAEAVRSSGKANPQWTNLMAQHYAKMSQINRKGAMARHKIRMDTNRDIMEMRQKSYARQNKMRDEGFDKSIQGIRDVETYKTTDSTAEVELPYTHDHAWKLDNDTYVLTNDANFKPFRDLGVDGEELEIAR
jgi:hypothetical protein